MYQEAKSDDWLNKLQSQDLNERERDIISERQLSENPLTLEELSNRYGVSRERIRQIEAKAFEKLQTKMTEKAKDINLLQYN